MGPAAAGFAAGLGTVAALFGARSLIGVAKRQTAANAIPGRRRVPAKTLPVPGELDDATAKLVGAPYSPLWLLDTDDKNKWRNLAEQAAARDAPRFAEARRSLDVSIEQTSIGGVNAYWLAPSTLSVTRRDRVVVNVHGSGFVFGTGDSGTLEAMLMAAHGGYRVLSVDYRMAPDHPFPAGLDDVVAVWRALVAERDPASMAMEGTSAGGNLILAAMLRLKTAGVALPGAIGLGSPAADLTRTGDSFATNEWVDNVLVSYDGFTHRVATMYADGHDLRDPLLSPVYGDLSGLPPAILMSGTRDLFLSSAVRTHRKLRRAGVEAALHLFEGLSHAQFSLEPDAPQAPEVYGEMASFFDRHLR